MSKFFEYILTHPCTPPKKGTFVFRFACPYGERGLRDMLFSICATIAHFFYSADQRILIFTFTLAALFLPLHAQSQFIRISMDIEPEMAATHVQPFQFETFKKNMETVSIDLGGANMGIYRISGIAGQHVMVSIAPPLALHHTNTEIDDQIPVSLNGAYANKNKNRIKDARRMQNNRAFSTLLENYNSNNFLDQVEAYIYLFGTMSVDDVEPGIYEGSLTITVEHIYGNF
jgi:hypothetical protein